ncbi:MAG: type II toxin-antitoxin system RelE/ParE family toxin [Candidatus Heimdallarchaeota archaeon]|nr:type II toxin-antitoxin system RelE/ParE family toxin [Candidatus Heimdallarchaeota archaeon]
MVSNQFFEVFLLPVAAKELKRLPKKVQKKIREFLVKLNQPYIISAKKMKGTENTYRIRIGDYQVLYKIYTDELIVVIKKI